MKNIRSYSSIIGEVNDIKSFTEFYNFLNYFDKFGYSTLLDIISNYDNLSEFINTYLINIYRHISIKQLELNDMWQLQTNSPQIITINELLGLFNPFNENKYLEVVETIIPPRQKTNIIQTRITEVYAKLIQLCILGEKNIPRAISLFGAIYSNVCFAPGILFDIDKKVIDKMENAIDSFCSQAVNRAAELIGSACVTHFLKEAEDIAIIRASLYIAKGIITKERDYFINARKELSDLFTYYTADKPVDLFFGTIDRFSNSLPSFLKFISDNAITLEMITKPNYYRFKFNHTNHLVSFPLNPTLLYDENKATRRKYEIAIDSLLTDSYKTLNDNIELIPHSDHIYFIRSFYEICENIEIDNVLSSIIIFQHPTINSESIYLLLTEVKRNIGGAIEIGIIYSCTIFVIQVLMQLQTSVEEAISVGITSALIELYKKMRDSHTNRI